MIARCADDGCRCSNTFHHVEITTDRKPLPLNGPRTTLGSQAPGCNAELSSSQSASRRDNEHPPTVHHHDFNNLFRFSRLLTRSTLFACIFSAIFSKRSFSAFFSLLSLMLVILFCRSSSFSAFISRSLDLVAAVAVWEERRLL